MSILSMVLAPLLFSVLFSLCNHIRSRRAKSHIPKSKHPLFRPRRGIFILLLIPSAALCHIYLLDARDAFSFFFVRILMMASGLGVLLLLLPAIRKILCAESCANLWMILCFLFYFSGYSPRWSIPLPFSPPGSRLVHTLVMIWLVGFAAVMLWSILAHLFFRHQLLKNARPVEDEATQQIWLAQLRIANLPVGMIRLCVCPDTLTPLSIGLFWRTTCLVLPERTYSDEELALILQHELIHISRRDSVLKFAMRFWAAIMWFNPLAWIALRVCAQDLELSCDETVLYGRPQPSRMEYARLLLQTASRQQGFTSCLSASAASLRYRLKNVVTSHKRIVGSFLIGLLCFLMLFGGMCTGIRYLPTSANELLFAELDVSQLDITEIYSTIAGVDVDGNCEEEQVLLDYIAALPLQQITVTPDVYSASNVVQLTIHATTCNYMLTFGDRYLRVVTITFTDSVRQKTSFYLLDSDPDWQLLLSCITPR